MTQNLLLMHLLLVMLEKYKVQLNDSASRQQTHADQSPPLRLSTYKMLRPLW